MYLHLQYQLYTKEEIRIESCTTILKLATKRPMQKSGLDMMEGSKFQMELNEYVFNADLPNI